MLVRFVSLSGSEAGAVAGDVGKSHLVQLASPLEFERVVWFAVTGTCPQRYLLRAGLERLFKHRLAGELTIDKPPNSGLLGNPALG